MAVKYLGSNCQADVCEADCAGQHQFYRARILQPRAVPDPSSSSSADATSLAASLSQAEAATSGRPVLLILDLHPHLRSGSLQELLQVETAERLQVSFRVCGWGVCWGALAACELEPRHCLMWPQ